MEQDLPPIESMEQLPPEVLSQIFLRLSPQELSRLSQTSSYIYRIVHAPWFQNQYLFRDQAVYNFLAPYYPEIFGEEGTFFQQVDLVQRLRFYALLQLDRIEEALEVIPIYLRPSLAWQIMKRLDEAVGDQISSYILGREIPPGRFRHQQLAWAMGWNRKDEAAYVNESKALIEAASLDYRPFLRPISRWIFQKPIWIRALTLAYRLGHIGFILYVIGPQIHDRPSSLRRRDGLTKASSYIAGWTGLRAIKDQLLGREIFSPESYVEGALEAGAIGRALEYPGLADEDVLKAAVRKKNIRYLRTLDLSVLEGSKVQTTIRAFMEQAFDPELFTYLSERLAWAGGSLDFLHRELEPRPARWGLLKRLERKANIELGRLRISIDNPETRTLVTKMAIHYQNLEILSALPRKAEYQLSNIAPDLGASNWDFVQMFLDRFVDIVGSWDLRVLVRQAAGYAAGRDPRLFEELVGFLARLPNPEHEWDNLLPREHVRPSYVQPKVRPGEPRDRYWVEAIHGSRYPFDKVQFEDFSPELAQAMKYGSQANIDLILTQLPYTVNSHVLMSALEYGYRELYPQLLETYLELHRS